MKRLADYTKEELGQLTSKDIDFLIDVECAHRGIPLSIELPEEPEQPKVKRDVAFCRVFESFCFKDEEEARKILELIDDSEIYHKPWGCKKPEKLTPDSSYYPTIHKEFYSSDAVLDEHQDENDKYDREKKAYEEIKKEYDMIFDKRRSVSDEVTLAAHDAARYYNKLKEFRRQFEEYMTIAMNIPDIALGFMIKAHPEIPELYPELIEEFAPGYKARQEDV
jgi:hypothetical protein